MIVKSSAVLVAGRYSLSLEKAGYFPRARGSSSGYPAIDVAADTPDDVDAGDIVFTRIRAISGRATWETGDPAEHVISHALLVRRNRAEFVPAMRCFPRQTNTGIFESEI